MACRFPNICTPWAYRRPNHALESRHQRVDKYRLVEKDTAWDPHEGPTQQRCVHPRVSFEMFRVVWHHADFCMCEMPTENKQVFLRLQKVKKKHYLRLQRKTIFSLSIVWHGVIRAKSPMLPERVVYSDSTNCRIDRLRPSCKQK